MHHGYATVCWIGNHFLRSVTFFLDLCNCSFSGFITVFLGFVTVVLDLRSFSWWPPSVQTHGLIQLFCWNTWYIPCCCFSLSLWFFFFFFSSLFIFAGKQFELPIFIFSMRNDENSFQFVLPSSSSFTCQQMEIRASIVNPAVYICMFAGSTVTIQLVPHGCFGWPSCTSWRVMEWAVVAAGVHWSPGACACCSDHFAEEAGTHLGHVPVVQIILLKRWAVILVGPVHSLKRTDRSSIFNDKSTMTVIFFFFLDAC